MKIGAIIKIVDEAYPDGLVGQYHAKPTREHGDGLARFIAIELKETFDAKATDLEQLTEAYNKMKSAYDELGAVVSALAGNIANAREQNETEK